LGRRLQTRYAQGEGESSTLITTSFYDPEGEFQEIGVQCGDKTFWKVYGPNECDAVTDETGASVILMHNAIGQLAGIVSQQGMLPNETFPSAYGFQEGMPSIPSDLVSYAQSLNWHSKAQDPTGLIWMGARYYDARSGRFLSPDPVSYPLCLDPYAYANGDPINYIDPDGRFRSYAYQIIKPILFEDWTSRFLDYAIHSWNKGAAYCAHIGWVRSSQFQVGSFDLPNGGIGFINGISNQLKQALKSAERLSQYAQGAKIYGVYNATNWDSIGAVSTGIDVIDYMLSKGSNVIDCTLSTGIDVIECMLGRVGIHTPTVQLSKDKWNAFFATHGPEAKFLDICHSGGAEHVKNALLTSPKSVQQRIIVLAIAPSVIIPEHLCYKSDNYISRRDFVTHLDVIGKLEYGDQLKILEPHPDANFWDHDFLSPTFQEKIERHILEYIKDYGSNG
jgi:RHS repeat-associated protein